MYSTADLQMGLTNADVYHWKVVINYINFDINSSYCYGCHETLSSITTIILIISTTTITTTITTHGLIEQKLA